MLEIGRHMDNRREVLMQEAVTYAYQKVMLISTNCMEAF